jgi:hypothetical protein
MSHETDDQSQDAMNIDGLTSAMDNPELFEGKKKEIQCMDGRINGGDGLAGSGILLERDPANPDLPNPRYMKILKERVAKGKLKEICWHSECGAAKLYLKGKGNQNPTPEQVDAAAKDFAEKFGKALGIPLKESAHEMAHHSEQGIYIDATDKFNIKSKKLPNGFILSPYLTNDFDYHLKEVEVAISISFGDHGPGPDSFSQAKPYFIILMQSANKSDYFDDFADEIQSMIDEKFPQFANKITIRTVTPGLNNL